MREIQRLLFKSYLLDGGAPFEAQMLAVHAKETTFHLEQSIITFFQYAQGKKIDIYNYLLSEEKIIEIVDKYDQNKMIILAKGASGLIFMQEKQMGQLIVCEPHFNEASIAAVCSFLLKETYKISELQPQFNKLQLQVAVEKVYFQCESTTYYLICPNVSVSSVLLSTFVSLVQLAVLFLLTMQSDLRLDPGLQAKNVIPQIFMATYLSFYLTNSISDIAISAIGADNTGKLSFSNLAAFLFRVIANLFRINSRVLTDFLSPTSLGFLSSVCILTEFVVMALLVGTTIVVISRASTPPEMIANFVGLLLILDLDNLVADNVKFKSFKYVLKYQDVESGRAVTLSPEEKETLLSERELSPPFGKFVISVWYFCILFFFMILT